MSEPPPEPPVTGAGGAPDPLAVAMRELLTLTALARTVMARRLGMSVHDLEAVEHVMLSPEPVGPADLSRLLGVSTAAATQSVHRLQAAGHMEREPHPVDGRRKVLRVTSSGADHVVAELRPLLRLTAAAADGLDERDRRAVARYLGGINDAYRTFLEDGPAEPRT